MRLVRRRRRARRAPPRRRPPLHRDRGDGRTCTCSRCPGTDLALANGLLHLAIKHRLVDAATSPSAPPAGRRSGARCAQYWPDRVERITGVPGADHGARGAPARRVARDDDPLRARRRAAREGLGHGAGVDQPRARPRPARPPVLRLGDDDRARATARAGASTARRPTSCPATGMLADPAARAHVAGVWGIDPDELPAARASPPTRCSTASAPPGGVRALLVMASNIAVSAPRRRATCASGSARSTSCASPTCSSPRPPSSPTSSCPAPSGPRRTAR